MAGVTIDARNGVLSALELDTYSTIKLSGAIDTSFFGSGLNEVVVKQSDITSLKVHEEIKKITLTNNGIQTFQNSSSSRIEPDFNTLTNLTNFILTGDHQLENEIPNLSANTSLIEFDVSNNFSLSGNIPELNNLPDLAIAKFSNNSFTGSLPSLSSNHKLVEFFSNGNNSITSDLPLVSSIFLKTINIQQNDVKGEPHDFRNTPLLENYFAFSCSLSGPLPALSACPKLLEIDFNGNIFKDNIPFVNNLTSVIQLNLNNNVLSGFCPEVNNLSALEFFRFNNNKQNKSGFNSPGITGDVPDVSGNINLKILDMASNALTGYTGSVWPSAQFQNLQVQNNNLTTAAVDTLLSALCAGGGNNGTAELGGTNASPTGGSSNPQKVHLEGRGWSIGIT